MRMRSKNKSPVPRSYANASESTPRSRRNSCSYALRNQSPSRRRKYNSKLRGIRPRRSRWLLLNNRLARPHNNSNRILKCSTRGSRERRRKQTCVRRFANRCTASIVSPRVSPSHSGSESRTIVLQVVVSMSSHLFN